MTLGLVTAQLGTTIKTLEKELNNKIYKLYGLTPSEIKYVDDSFK